MNMHLTEKEKIRNKINNYWRQYDTVESEKEKEVIVTKIGYGVFLLAFDPIEIKLALLAADYCYKNLPNYRSLELIIKDAIIHAEWTMKIKFDSPNFMKNALIKATKDILKEVTKNE
jgi:hypothetical protein